MRDHRGCCHALVERLERHPLVHVAERRLRTQRDRNGLPYGRGCRQEPSLPEPGRVRNATRFWSLVSFSTPRPAVGVYKSGVSLVAKPPNVFGVPNRLYTFDIDFLETPLLPPGTPSFRDVNTLTFRQLLRPTQ